MNIQAIPDHFNETVVRDMIIAYHEMTSVSYGETRIDALISMFTYFQSCTWYFKKYSKLTRSLKRAIHNFLYVDIPAHHAAESCLQDDSRMEKLFTLERIIEELDDLMRQ